MTLEFAPAGALSIISSKGLPARDSPQRNPEMAEHTNRSLSTRSLVALPLVALAAKGTSILKGRRPAAGE